MNHPLVHTGSALEHRDNVGTLQPRTRTTRFLSPPSPILLVPRPNSPHPPLSFLLLAINSTCCCGNYDVSNITRSCIDEIEMSASEISLARFLSKNYEIPNCVELLYQTIEKCIMIFLDDKSGLVKINLKRKENV